MIKENKMLKKVVTVIFALMLAVTMCAVFVSAEESDGPEANRDAYAYAVKGGTVTTMEELKAAFTDAREGNTTVYIDDVDGRANTVYLTENVVLKSPIIINSGSYTIFGADRTVFRGSDFECLFIINSSDISQQPSLTLSGEMVLDGMSDKYSADSGLVQVFGNSDFNASRVKFAYSDSNSTEGGALLVKTTEISDEKKTSLSPRVALDACEFVSCRAYGGGAIAAQSTGTTFDGSIKISKCSFTNNSALESDVGYSNGGAICIRAGYFEISECTFTGNTADNGGAIYAEKSSVITDCSFEYNAARIDGGAVHSVGSVDINGGKIMYNTAERNGGAIAGRGTVNTKTVYISENEAKNNGGAVHLEGTYNFNDGNITLCKAGNIGGGIYLKSKSSVLNMTDGEIVACRASYCASVYSKGDFNFAGGAIGNGESDFPQLLAYGKVTLGTKSFVQEDVFALAVTEKGYPVFTLSGVPEIKTVFKIAYAKEKLDDDGNTEGFSNATRNGKVFFAGSTEAVEKASEIFEVEKRGLLSYGLDEYGETSVRFIYLPIWAWILIGVGACGIAVFLFRKRIKKLFVKDCDKKNVKGKK